MKNLLLAIAILSAACRPSVLPGPTGAAQSSSVVVLALLVRGDTTIVPSWTPLCGGVVTAPDEVTTSLDCVVPKGVEVLELAVADFETWMTTSAGMTPVLLRHSDFDRRIATLKARRTFDGASVATPASRGFSDGQAAIVARNPERIEKAVVMAAGSGRGLISSRQSECRDMIAGAGVYDTSGHLVGIVTKGGLGASEYTTVFP